MIIIVFPHTVGGPNDERLAGEARWTRCNQGTKLRDITVGS